MLTPNDKRWLRETLRRLVRDELAVIAEDSMKQLGGYDGATVYVDDEEDDRLRARRPIGFVDPTQATGTVAE